MTQEEFNTKYNERFFDAQDTLLRIAANLSDIQFELRVGRPAEEINHTINMVKEYIFDARMVLRGQENNAIVNALNNQ